MQGLSKNVMRGVSSIALLSAARKELEGDSDEDYNLDFLDAPKKSTSINNSLGEIQPAKDVSISPADSYNSLNFSRSGIWVEDLCRIIARIDDLPGQHDAMLKQLFSSPEILLSAFRQHVFQQWHILTAGDLPHIVWSALFILSFAGKEELALGAETCLKSLIAMRCKNRIGFLLSSDEIRAGLTYLGLIEISSDFPRLSTQMKKSYSTLLHSKKSDIFEFASGRISIVLRLKHFFSGLEMIFHHAFTGHKLLGGKSELLSDLIEVISLLLSSLSEPIVQRFCVSECVGAVVMCVRRLMEVNVDLPSALTSLIELLVATQPKNATSRISTCDLTVMCASLSLDLSAPSIVLQKMFSNAIIKGRLLYSEEDSEVENTDKLISVGADFNSNSSCDKQLAILVQEIVKCIRKDRHFIDQKCECLHSFLTLIHCRLLAEGISFSKKAGDLIVENITSVRKDIVNARTALRSEGIKQAKVLEEIITCLSEIDFVWSTIKSKLSKEDLF